jgi:hypothetical protein
MDEGKNPSHTATQCGLSNLDGSFANYLVKQRLEEMTWTMVGNQFKLLPSKL